MTPKTARLLIGDPLEIDQLIEEQGADNAVTEIIKIRNELPENISPVAPQLAVLIANPILSMQDGVLAIKDDTEVTEEAAHNMAVAAAELFTACDKVHNIGRWVLGNIAHILDLRGYSIEQFLDPERFNYNTVVTSRTTFRFYQDKRYKIPFSTAKEIAYAKDLDDNKKHEIASFAEDNALSLNQTRAIMRQAQTFARDGTNIPPLQQLHDNAPTPTTAGHRYLVIGRTTREVMDHRPDEAKVEEAVEVYEIRTIIKSAE